MRSSDAGSLDAFVATLDARVLESGALDATIRPAEQVIAGAPPFSGTGTTLRVGAIVGEGGMGVVRLAEQGSLERVVAVKTVRAELREDPEAVARLIREARITGLVEHPNVVPLHALQRGADGSPQMIMKRIEGVPWRTLILDPAHAEMPADARDPLVWHIDVLMRVCDAIHYAHSRGILHLDIKPENVMIGRFREVYLVDWGIAASTRESHRGALPLVAELCEPVGTPAYMPPELVQPNERTPDERTDVYLLAATLHEIVTGRPPHGGATMAEALYAALVCELEPLPEDVPEELASIVRRGLAREPDERFASAEALRSALASFLAHRSSARLADDASAELEAIERTLSTTDRKFDPRRTVRSDGRACDFRDVVPEPGTKWSARAISTSKRNGVPGGTSSGGSELARRFGECLFGFRAALREWPENEAARRGLTDALLRMAEHHLDAGETSAAQAALAEADGVPSERRERFEALRARAAADAERKRTLTDLGREQDLSPGIGKRAIGIVSVVAVLNALVMIGWYHARPSPDHVWPMLLTGSAVLAVLSAGVAAYWRRHDTTQAARRLSRVLVLVVGALFVGRIGQWALGASLEHVMTTDTFLLATSVAVTGVTLDRRAHACAGFVLAAWVLMLLFPAHLAVWMSVGTSLGVGAMALLWIRGVAP